MMTTASPNKKHVIVFDDSGLEASIDFLQNRSDRNLEKLVSAPGNKLAYAHYRWSCPSPPTTAEEFWSTQMSKLSWSPELERNLDALEKYLLKQREKEWLNEVLNYLPRAHLFHTTVYLNLGYDNIVFGQNVALNMKHQQFSLDKRESKYYLIHELAHAGYVKYHPMPELWKTKTSGQLLSIIKYLTHLEGMGVISALRLRLSEGGLLDSDYNVLLNEAEKTRRVNHYFRIIKNLKGHSDKEVDGRVYERIFEKMSGKKTRLWYITGCYMAQEIEKHLGTEALRNLVRQGSEDFFDTYQEFEKEQH